MWYLSFFIRPLYEIYMDIPIPHPKLWWICIPVPWPNCTQSYNVQVRAINLCPHPSAYRSEMQMRAISSLPCPKYTRIFKYRWLLYHTNVQVRAISRVPWHSCTRGWSWCSRISGRARASSILTTRPQSFSRLVSYKFLEAPKGLCMLKVWHQYCPAEGVTDILKDGIEGKKIWGNGNFKRCRAFKNGKA